MSEVCQESVTHVTSPSTPAVLRGAQPRRLDLLAAAMLAMGPGAALVVLAGGGFILTAPGGVEVATAPRLPELVLLLQVAAGICSRKPRLTLNTMSSMRKEVARRQGAD